MLWVEAVKCAEPFFFQIIHVKAIDSLVIGYDFDEMISSWNGGMIEPGSFPVQVDV